MNEKLAEKLQLAETTAFQKLREGSEDERKGASRSMIIKASICALVGFFVFELVIKHLVIGVFDAQQKVLAGTTITTGIVSFFTIPFGSISQAAGDASWLALGGTVIVTAEKTLLAPFAILGLILLPASAVLAGRSSSANDDEKARKVFKWAARLFAIAIIGIVLIPTCALFSWLVEKLFALIVILIGAMNADLPGFGAPEKGFAPLDAITNTFGSITGGVANELMTKVLEVIAILAGVAAEIFVGIKLYEYVSGKKLDGALKQYMETGRNVRAKVADVVTGKMDKSDVEEDDEVSTDVVAISDGDATSTELSKSDSKKEAAIVKQPSSNPPSVKVLSSVSLIMGAAVALLGLLGFATNICIVLLGVGLFCLTLATMRKK